MSLRRRWLADLGATLTRPARAWLARRAAIRNREFPEGCCECGTGGPYYRGPKTPVVRYLYSGACHGTPAGEVDWASCSRHPLDMAPLVDYGSDVPVTARRADADAVAAASRAAFEQSVPPPPSFMEQWVWNLTHPLNYPPTPPIAVDLARPIAEQRGLDPADPDDAAAIIAELTADGVPLDVAQATVDWLAAESTDH